MRRFFCGKGFACLSSSSSSSLVVLFPVVFLSNETQRRLFARGRPYAPRGTFQDFTASPQHMRLAEMQRELDEMCGRAPTHSYEGPEVTAAAGGRFPSFPAEMNDEVPQGPGAVARRRMLALQSDSYGDPIRGVVSPPPPPDANAPREYKSVPLELGGVWWGAMMFILLTFLLLAKYGQ